MPGGFSQKRGVPDPLLGGTPTPPFYTFPSISKTDFRGGFSQTPVEKRGIREKNPKNSSFVVKSTFLGGRGEGGWFWPLLTSFGGQGQKWPKTPQNDPKPLIYWFSRKSVNLQVSLFLRKPTRHQNLSWLSQAPDSGPIAKQPTDIDIRIMLK